MHLPDEFWLKFINWIVNLAFRWVGGQQKVKRLEAQLEKREAELAACKQTSAWVVPLAAAGLFLAVVLIFSKAWRA